MPVIKSLSQTKKVSLSLIFTTISSKKDLTFHCSCTGASVSLKGKEFTKEKARKLGQKMKRLIDCLVLFESAL